MKRNFFQDLNITRLSIEGEFPNAVRAMAEKYFQNIPTELNCD